MNSTPVPSSIRAFLRTPSRTFVLWTALLLSCCGGGGSSANASASAPAAALAVSAGASSNSVTTYGPAYAVTTLTASAGNGTAPYTYQWSSIGTAHSTVSNATVAAPTVSATVNWGDQFTDQWQVTVTDAANHSATGTVSVSFIAPPSDGMPAGAMAVPLQGTIVSDSITSKLGAAGTYPLRIYLPADYNSTSDKLPVIYATDGVADLSDPTQYNGWQTPDMARILEAKGLRAIVVGIGGYEMRNTDYLMPGAANYYGFITQELIPHIESSWRASATNRTLSGHSYGGIFVGLALLMDRPAKRYFSNFISLDGSYWNQPDATTALLQTLQSASGGNLPNTTLILSSASGGNDAAVTAFYQQLTALNFQQWQLTRIPVYNTSHLQMFDEGFAASIDVIFSSATSQRHTAHPPPD